MLSRVRITLSAPLIVGVPVLVVGLWLSAMWNRQSQRAVADLAQQNIEQIHELAANKVADVLSIPVRICEVNAHLVQSNALDPSDLEAWRPTLVRQAQAFEMLSAIRWGGADGRSAWVSRYADGSYYWAIKDDPRWASAGHGPPIIYDAESDSFPELSGGGLPLGLVAGESCKEYVEAGVRPGDLILAATD
jgi:sigma-B regulation protein RsbU (phosphoserine phosphatase)